MTRRRKLFALALGLVLLALAVGIFLSRSGLSATTETSHASRSTLGTNPVTANPTGSVLSLQEVVQRIRQDPQWAWKRAISFYGKVLDESGQAIPGATAVFGWSNEKREGREATAISDGSGFFSLSAIVQYQVETCSPPRIQARRFDSSLLFTSVMARSSGLTPPRMPELDQEAIGAFTQQGFGFWRAYWEDCCRNQTITCCTAGPTIA